MLKMLVPVDGSESSTRALDFAIGKKDWYKDGVELHIINVQPPMPYGSSVSSVIGKDAMNKYHRDEAMSVLNPVMQKLDAAGVKYVHHICVGEPAELIADFAKEKGCDQIIMGARGMGTASLLLGSVATKTIHASTVPVLLVK